MTSWWLSLSAWHTHPSVLLGCVALLAGYLAALRFHPPGSALYYLAGVLVLLFALLSPLHTLGDSYLFSAHMLQHLLLVQVVPPLLLLGIPAALAQRVLNVPVLRAVEGALNQALPAWSIGIGALWVWHLPAFYNAALEHEGIHIAEHLCFLATATIFWWPIVGPLPERRLAPLAAALYLFAAMVAGSVLGIILTFAPPGLYPTYLNPVDRLGIVVLLREGWGLSPAIDQQLGGLLMWVPGNLVYFWACVAALARWYSAPEAESLGPTR
jgi:cytochrome c oxidase assembly factor CtaG